MTNVIQKSARPASPSYALLSGYPDGSPRHISPSAFSCSGPCRSQPGRPLSATVHARASSEKSLLPVVQTVIRAGRSPNGMLRIFLEAHEVTIVIELQRGGFIDHLDIATGQCFFDQVFG